MAEMAPVLVTASVGVVLLVVLVLLALAPVRRFTRASATLRAAVADRVATLRELAAARRPGPR